MQIAAAHAAGEPRRPDGPGRARPAGADPGQAPCTRTSTTASRCARTRPSCRRSTIRCSRSRCARRSASSSSRTRCSRSRWRSPGFSVGEAEGLRRAMSRKRSEAALEAFRGRFVEGALGKRRRRGGRARVYDKLAASPASASRSRTRPRSGCSRTSRRGCATTIRGVPLRAPERAADGLLPAGIARPGRAAARGGGAAAGREPQRRRSARSRTTPFGSGSNTSARSERTEAEALVAERARAGRSRSVRELAQRSGLDRPRLEALVASGACDCFGDGAARAALGARARAARAERPGARREERQLALPLDPTAATPALREQTPWERMLADYRTTSLSVGVHPLELLRPHLPAGVLSSRELAGPPTGARSPCRGWPSQGSARRPRTASSSCCSRTSTARST